MKASSAPILIFLACGLAGPILRWATWPPTSTSSGSSSADFVYELVLLLWPTQPLAVLEAVIGSFAAITLSVGANMLVFGSVGLLASAISQHKSRLISLYVVICLGLALFAFWVAGYSAEFVHLGALVTALVLYALPFMAAAALARNIG
jgi:hypothetical protein